MLIAVLVGMSATASVPTHISIVTDATETEKFAASELQGLLSSVCSNTTFKIGKPLRSAPQIAIGPGAALAVGAKLISGMGNESYLLDTTSSIIIATGGIGSARGTLYSVYGLAELLGWRFYSYDETKVPVTCPVSVPEHSGITKLPFEYRDNNQWQPEHHNPWAIRSRYNGNASPDRGDAVTYATPPGFVHTSYALLYYPETSANVPPPHLFKLHPEWFWPPPAAGGGSAYGQLCWSNSSLVSYLTSQVLAILKAQPDAQILSVSQNDNYDRCLTATENATNDAEGSPMGAMLRAVNHSTSAEAPKHQNLPARPGCLHHTLTVSSASPRVRQVADTVSPGYPNVAIDTLAYQVRSCGRLDLVP